MKLVDKNRKKEWAVIKLYPLQELADIVGRRLFNNIDLASRREPKKGRQHESTTVVVVGKAELVPMADLLRVRGVVRELSARIADSHINLGVEDEYIIENPGRKSEQTWVVIKIVATYGDNLPLSDANLAPVRWNYRRLMEKRAQPK